MPATRPTADARPKLIYVLGSGRSGSTILDLLLGSHQEVASCGELHAFRTRALHEDRPCSCGQPFSTCAQWSQVIERLASDRYFTPSAQFTMRKLFSRREKAATLIAPAWLLKPAATARLLEYGTNEARLLHLVADTVEAPILVDSSKSIERLLALHATNEFDIKVIRLERSGLAVLDSTRRAFERDQSPRTSRVFAPAHITRWVLTMRKQRKVLAGLKDLDTVVLNYKDMTTDPSTALARVAEAVGIEFDPEILAISSDRYLFRQTYHVVGGNRMKFADPETTITYHGDWKHRLHRSDRVLYRLLGGHRLVDPDAG